MNPQQPGGQPSQQFHEPQGPHATPHAPSNEWAQSNDPLRSAQHFSHHEAFQHHADQPHDSLPQATNPVTPSLLPDHYDFILNPGQSPRPSLFGGGSAFKRVAIVLVGVALLVVVIAVVASLLSGDKGDFSSLVVVAEDQTELIRVSNLANNQPTAQTTQNVAVDVNLSLTTANQQLLSYLATVKKSPDVKTLALKHDSRTDTSLTAAVAASDYDSVFMQIIQTELTEYQRDLKAAYATNPGPTGDRLLRNQFSGDNLLIAQTKSSDQ